jgi:hypothetical protein
MFSQKQLVYIVSLVSANTKLDVCDLRSNGCAVTFVSGDFAGRFIGFEDPKFFHSSVLLWLSSKRPDLSGME